MSFIKVRNLSKQYGDISVFKNVNLDIKKGEFITLLGPSGCGKSTLLRCIAGLNESNGGEIIMNGKVINNTAPKDREIGMVFQNYALFPNMTVKENVAFGLKIKRQDNIEEKVKKYLSMVELNEREDYYPHELSGGQKQRVALARTLIMEPKIILLDEPLSALDAKIRKNLREKISEIQRKLGITTIFVTHDQEEALTISDRVFIMEEGKFAQIGTPEEVYTHPVSEFVVRFIGNYNIFEREEVESIFKWRIEKNIVAIRPESIYIREEGRNYIEDNFIAVKANIIESAVLGNIIRYRVEKNGIKFIVDLLNRGENKLYKVGLEIELLFMKNEIKKF
ncbi:ABC transporter ATP-binding protein [Psychrilyobacter atlanticus]|uniref:ABC transporter ATP-binding protein n=1 Tax=Psychrilyobacter atlanticus TaxID=271091 RepID=UPI00040BECBB|nr:ABC transporter ATP-binding protein [Psychrilyobacter atlanticus]